LTEIYTCPSCGFKIEIKQILTKEQIPTAIENKKKRRNIEELVVQDIVAKKANAPDKDEQHAELIYQKFWQSDDGRKVYEAARKEFPDNFQEQTDFVMNAITSEFELDHNERNLVQNKVLDGLV
jgi:glutaredoxin